MVNRDGMPERKLGLQAYYRQFDEDSRLQWGPFQLEQARTRILLQRYLPPPPAIIYDVGGGTGPYAHWLAEAGYVVHLLDFMPHHIEKALTKKPMRLQSAIAGDAQQLPYDDASADAVLLLGPLYHLQELQDRLRALREARRVLKTDGMLFAACISRYASTLDGLKHSLLKDPDFVKIALTDLQTGRHSNPGDLVNYFTDAYFHRPADFQQEIKAAGFAQPKLLPIEGPGWLAKPFDDWWMQPHLKSLLLELAERFEQETDMIGLSAHIMAVARPAQVNA